jgi:hypothetical protein
VTATTVTSAMSARASRHGTGPSADIVPAATGPPASTPADPAHTPTAETATPSAAARPVNVRTSRPTTNIAAKPAASGTVRTA